ncbi:MAG: SEC-C domain-containing protein [Sedimentisphaerales bacterium]|nr:SEC-C domain-containing protein [Sedimentisphaerales bacterium]
MKIGRNQKCPCGSGKKYKHCCAKPEPSFDPVIAATELSLRDRNIILFNEIFDIFKINEGIDWSDIQSTISDDQIRHMYQIVADLWHYKTDIGSLLPKPDNKLRALYQGDIAPELLVRNVFRFSLYADEILVVSPFLNPWGIREEYNPIDNPAQHKVDALKLVFFAIQMAPWIDAGLVNLIPDPSDYDHQLKIRTWKMAEQRIKKDMPTDEDMAPELNRTEEELRSILLASPNEYLIRKMRQYNSDVSEKEIKGALEYVDQLREQSLFMPMQTLDMMGPQLLSLRLGVNLEMALYLCQSTGAFPYTNVKYRWKELQSVKESLPTDAEIWTPLTKAFSDLDFRFLDNINTSFACNMRKENRLEGFRTFLRRMWSTLNNEDDLTKLQSKSRDFADELSDEYHKAKAEWDKIDTDLIKWLGGTISTGIGASGLGAIIDGKLGIAAGASFAIKAVTELVAAKRNRRSFREKVPMSVFIDLNGK